MTNSYARYFTNSSSRSWDILKYLDYCIDSDRTCGRRFDFNAAINAWLKSLRKYRDSNRSRYSDRAKSLLHDYFDKNDHSDKQRSRRHFANAERSQLAQFNIRNNYGEVGYKIKLKKGSYKRPIPNEPVIPDSLSEFEAIPDNESESSVSSSSMPIHYLQFLTTLREADKLILPNDTYLEDHIYGYALSITELDLVHWAILDFADTQLMSILNANGWRDSNFASSPLPQFPTWLSNQIDRYSQVTDVSACVSIAHSSQQEFLNEMPPREHIFLKQWVDRCCQTIVLLLSQTHSFFSNPLAEGVWECIYWTILDLSFINLDYLFIQRRDIVLSSLKSEHFPLVDTTYRFDGVIRSSTSASFRRPLEFGVIEVSKHFVAEDASKWNNDMAKLYVGCRAILKNLKSEVNHDPETIRQLSTVGILQAGDRTMVIVMRCVGSNLFALKRGCAWKLPTHLTEFKHLHHVLAAIWVARECIKNTYNAINRFQIGSSNSTIRPTDPDFL